ncbi:MAG: hypothetical protein JWR44_2624 [Hymenobacter sp.]|jgi:hypothetical protein|nr:hypothetical protein [Hymenobacter sp.]
MKSKTVFLVLISFLYVSSTLRAQGIRFEKDSLTQVFAKARQQSKPVFLLLSPPPMTNMRLGPLTRPRSEISLNAPAVASILNKDFLNKELVMGTPEAAEAARRYSVLRYPSYLYLAPDGSLLHRSAAIASNEQYFLDDINAFRQAQADPQSLSSFKAQYEQGNRSAAVLKQYIAKSRQVGQLVEPELLDAYVAQLPARAFDRAAEVVFVLENGPVVNSRAQLAARRNGRLYDSLYRVLPLAQRIAINQLIISNTMAQASATKNLELAVQGAEFARRTWGSSERGTHALEEHMLDFYSGTRDTANYLRAAVDFYERNYMSVSADSARKVVAFLQAFRREQASELGINLNKMPGRPAGGASAGPGTYVVRRQIQVGPPNSFLKDLNTGAKAIYQTGTRNGKYLQPALLWSQRTVGLDPTSYHRDTLAHLLYRLGRYAEAEAMQQQAVADARQEKESPTAYEQELEKMRKRTL